MLKGISIFILIVLATVVHGYVLSLAWNILLVRIFDIPTIGIIEAISLATVISLFIPNNPINREKRGGSFWEIYWKAIGELLIKNVTFLILIWLLGSLL